MISLGSSRQAKQYYLLSAFEWLLIVLVVGSILHSLTDMTGPFVLL